MEKIFTLVKKVGIDKKDLTEFVQRVQNNVVIVNQYLEPIVESGLEIIREESSKAFNEILKDLSFDEVLKENEKFKPTIDMCFQDFLEFNGVTWNRYKLLSGKYNQKQTREFIWCTNPINWLNLSFAWTTEEGIEFWENLHYQWKECCNYAIGKDIQIIFNREENESPEYFTKEEVQEEVQEDTIEPVKIVLNFKSFLKENGINIKQFKQSVIEKGSSLEELGNSDSEHWINDAFDWDNTVRTFEFWDDLDTEWREEVKIALQFNREIIFELKDKVKKLNFKKFLKSRNKLDLFKRFVKDGNYYLRELKELDRSEWLNQVFSWNETFHTYEVWNELNNQWIEQVVLAQDSNIKVVFGFKV